MQYLCIDYSVPFLLYAAGLSVALSAARSHLARVEQLISVGATPARIVPVAVVVFVALAYRRTTEPGEPPALPDRPREHRISRRRRTSWWPSAGTTTTRCSDGLQLTSD